MEKKAKKKTPTYGWVAILLSGLVGPTISMFLKGQLVPMPIDFPYSRGWWGVIGVAVILLAYFLLGALITFIVNQSKVKKDV